MAFILSPLMSLPVPIVGTTAGPEYATDLNSCFAVIDQHDHSPGAGTQITPDGLNINNDLTFQSHNATLLRSARFSSQGAVLSGALDVGCLYVSGVDLYYNDTAGTKIRMTQSGGVSGTPGSISNLISPATASYSAGLTTFIWQSAANTPANLDAGSIILRNVTAGSNGITISAPGALPGNYVITLPASPPVSTKILTMSSSGVIAPAYDLDNASLEVSAGLIRLKDGGIAASKYGTASIPVTALGYTTTMRTQVFSSSGTFVVPAGVLSLCVRAIGGGGGGAGGRNDSGSPNYYGGAGGSSGFFGEIVRPVTPGETVTVTVGIGGAGGGSNSAGNNGGNTVVSSATMGTLAFYGGYGGPGSSIATPSAIPGLFVCYGGGGTTSGGGSAGNAGSFNITASGGAGGIDPGVNINNGGCGGGGGAGFGSGGAGGGGNASGIYAPLVGSNGSLGSGGGGGGGNKGPSPGAAGGSGGNGYAELYYVQAL